jgi:hypothetical protein
VPHLQKDKACLPFSGDPTPYPAAGGPQTKTLAVKDIAPDAHFAPQVFIRCADQSDDNTQWCHVANRLSNGKAPTLNKTLEVFWRTRVIDSRPTNLYVAVFICCAIGPIMLVAFLIYERGILAKQA